MGTPAGGRLYLDGLTGLRAYAACWVMLFHVNAIVGPKRLSVQAFGMPVDVTPLVTIGWVGVDVFFALSGFLLTTHLLERWDGAYDGRLLRGYLAARVRRVFPAYWAQLAVLLAVAVVAAGGAMPAWLRHLPLHVPMLHNLSVEASFAINPVYWTLPVEFGFYLCLPAIAGFLARGERMPARLAWRRLAGLVALVLAGTWAYRYAAFRAYEGSAVNTIVWATSQLPGTLDQFVTGAATAAGVRLLARGRAPGAALAGPGTSTALLAVGTAGVVAMMYFIHRIHEQYWAGHWALVFWHTVTSAFIACVILAIVIGGPAARLAFDNRIAVFLGTVSYSIYLWHFPVAVWAAKVVDVPALGLAGALLAIVPLVVAASALSYRLVERPFLRRAR
jgi:peptidoglycan/LPS O-acetylase OafA/YrhL